MLAVRTPSPPAAASHAVFSIPNATPLPDNPQTRQIIVLTVGLPGSGKSTWLADRGLHAISTDRIRALLSDDATNQTIHAQVFATARYLLRQRLAIHRPFTYVDATHLTRAERRPYIEIADWYGCDIEAIYFNIPVEECLRRNALRERIVPPDAIRAMAAKLQIPELVEGFTQVTHESCDLPLITIVEPAHGDLDRYRPMRLR